MKIIKLFLLLNLIFFTFEVKAIPLKKFLIEANLPIYESLNKAALTSLNELLNTSFKSKNEIEASPFCFFAINLFYASNDKDPFTIKTLLSSFKENNPLKTRLLECILSDIKIVNGIPIYVINSDINYNIMFLTGKKYSLENAPLVSTLKLAKVTTAVTKAKTDKKNPNPGSVQILKVAAEAWSDDKLTRDIITGITTKNYNKVGGAIVFLGIREGLTEEQKREIADKMTKLATDLHLAPVKKAIDAYLESNVRIYVKNANSFLVNYKLGF